MGPTASPPAQCAPRDSVAAGSECCPARRPALELREFHCIPTTFPARPSEACRGLLAERIRKATAEGTVGPKLYSKRYDHYISKRLPV